jgi:hypothetical protein
MNRLVFLSVLAAVGGALTDLEAVLVPRASAARLGAAAPVSCKPANAACSRDEECCSNYCEARPTPGGMRYFCMARGGGAPDAANDHSPNAGGYETAREPMGCVPSGYCWSINGPACCRCLYPPGATSCTEGVCRDC